MVHVAFVGLASRGLAFALPFLHVVEPVKRTYVYVHSNQSNESYMYMVACKTGDRRPSIRVGTSEHSSCVYPVNNKQTCKMENKFIPDAIEIVGRAIKADNDSDYEQALNLYRDALGRFTMGLKYEKNESRKKLIIERVEGYMKRAEELRDYLNKQQELENKGGGGAASKKRGEGDDDDDAKEKSKLRGALAGAIVTEKPDVKWDDVAGLEGAKDSLKEVCRNELIWRSE